MGFMTPKRSTLLFVLILASLISASSAGRKQRFFDHYAAHVGSMVKESAGRVVHHEQAFIPHSRSRVLKVNTNDYGKYDPSPSLAKPPFKLIPN